MSTNRRSRNGCVNCKTKRQKCDEARPSCLRCQRAGLECKGYAGTKELRWRSVDKGDLSAKVAAKPKKVSCRSGTSMEPDSATLMEEQTMSMRSEDWQESLTSTGISSPDSDGFLTNGYLPSGVNEWTSMVGELPPDAGAGFSGNYPVDFDAFNLSAGLFPMSAVMVHSGLPTTEPQTNGSATGEADISTMESSQAVQEVWPSPKSSFSSSVPGNMIPRLSLIQPIRHVQDMLLAHFDRQTCGILSIKDGSVENPWRTLILPLSSASHAVEHAITCMAAFHGAYDSPDLHSRGTTDMKESYKSLALEGPTQPMIPTLAAWVSLAFAEGWKAPTKARTTPMANARRLINERFSSHRSAMSLTKTDTARLKYLINAFAFVHTIAGITARPCEDAEPLPQQVVLFLTPSPDEPKTEVDPLLGCAMSLFPLIDKVVSLVQKARKTQRNSLSLVGQAGEVYDQLQQWQPPRLNLLESLDDEGPTRQHSIQTAQALRYATLLHLHQAVPEIPSESSQELARRVLLKLASIPSSSRMTNLHIFPLLVASGELTDPEDREWAEGRWHAMIGRLRVKNVDTCWDIVQATWARRDVYEAERGPAASADSDFEMDPAYTVRGKLHWLNIMEDRNWQVFVG